MITRPDLSDVSLEKAKAMLEVLKTWKVPMQSKSRYRKATGHSRSASFGYVRKRHRQPGVSMLNSKVPHVWNALKDFADSTGFLYDSIQVNQDVVCTKHRDKNNTGDSYLISLGDFTGGELIVEEILYDCKMKPIVFNGALMEHYNNPFVGSKWSVILFKSTIPDKWKSSYPDDWRQCTDYIRMKARLLSEVEESIRYIKLDYIV